MERHVSYAMIASFARYLREHEKSRATIEKYIRDVRRFADFTKGEAIEKSHALAYKAALQKNYAIASANSMIASLNAFFRFAGWLDLCIRQFRVQRQIFTPEEKELSQAEYERLVRAARSKGNERLCLILQTVCATGIRISELQHITVEAVNTGEAIVQCKGKTRAVFLVADLRRQLTDYIRRQSIVSGPVFITRRGKPVSRTAVWREMKALCMLAKVSPGKVFPHNLRHLFARTFYSIEKDIAKLADILGHTSVNTTRIYIATTGAEYRRRMEHMRLVLSACLQTDRADGGKKRAHNKKSPAQPCAGPQAT